MKTILITAYAMNPYKGSEDGMGWNFVLQAARYHSVVAVTRRNNRTDIEHYINNGQAGNNTLSQVRFLYFDWPRWMLFWKKGPLLSMIYYYGWQFTLALWLCVQRPAADIVHNLNFHNDWTPTFLWLTGKPVVWGPVGHHPPIRADYILPVYGYKAWLKDRLLWGIKNIVWHCDPFLWIARHKARHVLCMNEEAVFTKMRGPSPCTQMPSVAAEAVKAENILRQGFMVLSAGRFVPLKGFDLTIRAFGAFYRQLPSIQRTNVKLVLAGSGPALPRLRTIITEQQLEQVVTFIEWLPRQALNQLYQDASVFLFPSHEGASMVVAEAMRYSLPVVCLDNAGPGAFLHPQSMLKVPYGQYDATIQALADLLHRLFQDKAFAGREATLARERFEQHLCWDIRGAQLKQVYDTINIPAPSMSAL